MYALLVQVANHNNNKETVMTKSELNNLFKEYPEEMEDMSLHELKLLMSWRLKMMGITRWDEFQDEFVDDLRRTHNDYLLGLGLETDKEQMAKEKS
tara:strand:- start:233 stop:520 length:288 start_codon:yes stop_codon:yes gene_type:complete